MFSKSKSPKLREKALIYSKQNEELPHPFVKLMEREREKQERKWNRYQEGKFSTPQCQYSSQSKRLIFTPQILLSPQRLFNPTTPSKILTLTPIKNDSQSKENNDQLQKEDVISLKEQSIDQFKNNQIESPVSDQSQLPIQQDNYQQQQEPEIQPIEIILIPQEIEQHIEQVSQVSQQKLIEINQENIQENHIQSNNQQQEQDLDKSFHSKGKSSQVIVQEQLNLINQDINQHAQKLLNMISDTVSRKNLHTQQFIKLLYQCYEICNQIIQLNDKQKIGMKAKILQDLIAYFASVLPDLESRIIKEIVNKSTELAHRKIECC